MPFSCNDDMPVYEMSFVFTLAFTLFAHIPKLAVFKFRRFFYCVLGLDFGNGGAGSVQNASSQQTKNSYESNREERSEEQMPINAS